MDKVNVVVLAAGKGTRLNANKKPKVMYKVKGKPMLGYWGRMLAGMEDASRKIIVVGFKGRQIIDYLESLYPQVFDFVWQKRQLGTAHAVEKALPLIFNSPYPTVVFNGDHPYFSVATIRRLARTYQRKKTPLVITTVIRENDPSFGRVIKDSEGAVKKIVEVKNCAPQELKVNELNVGAYLFDTAWLKENISQIKKNNVSGEYYLTDLVGLAVSQGKKVLAVEVVHPAEAIGINTARDLEEVGKA